jgi:hypothetical protein
MKTLYVVHCIDTEGPLYESLSETFKRLRNIFNIEIAPSQENLTKLQNGEIELGGLESSVQKVLAPNLISYLDTWDKIDVMLDDIMSSKFRQSFPDSRGNGWIYNWHCLDHVQYDINPRRRDIGFHNIFDHYAERLKLTKSFQDGLQFHFHPRHPYLNNASICATHWFAHSSHLFEILARRVLDRQWFPCVNRPGFHVNRPDSHWFLEQYMPFDYSNQAIDLSDEDQSQKDLSDGRFGDWRNAPKTWTPYHPSHDDYQLPGDCRRWIARCLNIGTRLRLLSENEIRTAFSECDKGAPVILSFTNHDFRDIREDISNTYALLKKVSADYPNVSFEYTDAIGAFRKAMDLPNIKRCELDIELTRNGSGHILNVTSNQNTFGPQPFFCFKTRSGKYIHDNLDFDENFRKWSYSFDNQTVQLDSLEKIGIGTNNAYGITTVVNIDTRTKNVTNTYWNEQNTNHMLEN